MVESAREFCGSVGVEGKNPKGVKAAFMRKEMLGARDEEAKERCMEAY